MTILTRYVAGLAAAGAALLSVGFAQAQEHNWMRDYVELRRQAMLVRAVGAERAAEITAAQARIIGGTTAKPSSNPFQVALLFKDVADNWGAQYCGGTLYKKVYVITAAHCSDFVTPSQVQVLTGARKLDGSGVRRNVVSIKIHSGWDDQTYNNDVAIWKLATPGPSHDLELAKTDPSVGRKLLATGWGNMSTSGSDFPINLMEVKLPMFSRSNCNDDNSYMGYITSAMLCAGYDAGGKDTCQGDSGGPLTQDVSGGSVNYKTLVGVTSWGYLCAQANYPGVYTRVSNKSIRNFIVKNTQ